MTTQPASLAEEFAMESQLYRNLTADRRPRRRTMLGLGALAALALGAALAACGNDDSGRTIRVTGKEYNFEAPSTIKSGRVTFDFKNGGEEQHELFILRVADGHTYDEVFDAQGQDGTADNVGAVFAKPGQGAGSQMTVTLQKGTYVFVCGIPDPDGTPHAQKGMVRQVTVT